MSADAVTPARRRDVVGVAALTIAAAAVAIATLYLSRLPSPYAPVVHVRWADGTSENARADLERRFRLHDGTSLGETTWRYAMTDASAENVRALVADAAVADTHHIDRRSGRIASDAPQGTTRLVDGGPRLWKESPAVEWAGWISVSTLVLSGAWLVQARSARR